MGVNRVTFSRGRVLAVATSGAMGVLVLALAFGSASAAPAPAGTGSGRELMTVFAGGAGGPGPATTVGLVPCGVVASAGHLYVADSGQSSVRNVNSRTGWLTTIAGIGVPGSAGAGGPARSAELGQPCALTMDKHGNLVLVTTSGVPSVQVIAARSGTFYGRRMRAGDLYTVATSELAIGGVAVDYAGNLVLAIGGSDYDGHIQDASVTVVPARAGTFYGEKMQPGQTYAVQTLNGISAGAITVDLAGNPVLSGFPEGPGGDSAQTVVLAARSGRFDGRVMLAGHVYPIAQSSNVATVDRYGNVILAGLGEGISNEAGGVAVAATRTGTFYGRKMRAGHTYRLTTNRSGYSGDGGPAAKAEVRGPRGVTTDKSGNIVIADTGNHRVRVIATTSGIFYGIKMRAGDIYTIAGTGSPALDSGDGGEATRAELAASPPGGYALRFRDLAVDQSGNAYIADSFNNRIAMVPSRSGVFWGQRMRAGDIYTIAGTGTGGYSGNGGPAISAMLNDPAGLTFDHHGNLLIADVDNSRVRVIPVTSGRFYGIAMRANHLYTIAGGGTDFDANGIPATTALISPAGVAIDAAGNVLITSQDDRLLVVAATSGSFYGQAIAAGDIYRIGLNVGSGKGIIIPSGITVDSAGDPVIAAGRELTVLAVRSGTFYGQPMTAGDTYAIAGGGTSKGSGVPALEANLRLIRGIAIDRNGNILIAESQRNLLQVLAVRSGTFYGQAMTRGDIYTIAGGGNGYIPGNRSAASVKLISPEGVAIEPSGNILLSDALAGRVVLLHP
jgi:hypothetical protein